MAYKAYKYRIYPNKTQQGKMMMFFGCARVVYNMCLEHYTNEYKRWKEEGGPFEKTPLVTALKREKPFLKECDNAALAYARAHFDKAMSEFLKSKKGLRKGKKLGFPKMKKRGKCRYSYRTCDAHGGIRFDDDGKHLRLPKIGWVRCVMHRPCDGEIKAVTVSMTKSGRFHVSIMAETVDTAHVFSKKAASQTPSVVGLDMSVPRFLVSSCDEDNAITKYCREYRREERRLGRLARRMSRKSKGSSNRDKARRRHAALSERVANRRADFVIKIALHYARKYDVVVIEDLDMQSMSRSLHLGKSVMDLGWGMFVRWLEVECEKHGTILVKADRWFPSSKTCHECGTVNDLLKLSDREWVCPHCGCVVDRDKNASLNLRDYWFKMYNTAGTAGIHACGDNTSAHWKTSVVSAVDETRSPSL